MEREEKVVCVCVHACKLVRVMSNSLQPHELDKLEAASLLYPWDSPDKNTGVGCCSFLQRIFLTQGLNLGLLQCRQIPYCLTHHGGALSHQGQVSVTTRHLHVHVSLV